MSYTTAELQLIEQRVQNEGPNILIAYLLWGFLGLFSAHRFYLGRPGSAIFQIVSYFLLFGFVWLLVDAFLIPGMVKKKREDLRADLMRQPLGSNFTPPAAPVVTDTTGVNTDKLHKLWELKQAGAISDEEFEAQKAKLL